MMRLSALAKRLRVDRPLRMFRWGRSEKPEFAAQEYLFQRFSNVGFEQETTEMSVKQIVSEQIRWAEQSVNRSNFGKPIDVLFPHWCHEGIFGYTKDSLPKGIVAGASRKQVAPIWNTDVEHAPLWDNYGHSNIYALKDGTKVDRNRSSSVSGLAKKKAREAIVNHPSLKIIRRPTPSEKFSWLRRRIGL